ncbi:MAG: iron export ABC transporter permease subunit FetB [Magnetococcales bacterium]|nr:iron export ABC transporter permease subunit FetB [Magnetococcales bacterium]
MDIILLTPFDLGLAASLVILLAIFSEYGRLKLGIGRKLVIAAVRASVQLMAIGLVLKVLFESNHPLLMMLMATVMLLMATREIAARQEMGFVGWWGFAIGGLSLLLSSFLITLFALTVILSPTPWYTPQYAIPLLGMLLGNTMNGIALALDRLTREVVRERGAIEARLLMGHSWQMAIQPYMREAIRAGTIPIINTMAVSGVVTLPGMMTGQILAGNPPGTASNYQIMILFLIAAGTGFGISAGVWLASRRFFDERQRLRLDRLKKRA